MNHRKQCLTPEQRLKLADQIRQLVEDQYPAETFDGQDEALAIALVAMTGARNAGALLGAGGGGHLAITVTADQAGQVECGGWASPGEAPDALRDAHQLQALAIHWEALSRGKFASALVEADPMGRRLIEHGAHCYLNCAVELKALIAPLQGKTAPPSADRR